MKNLINIILIIITSSLLLISCSNIHEYVRQDDLFKSFYFEKLRYPISMDEILDMYHDGVYQKLYNEANDSLAAKRFMELHEYEDSVLANGTEGMRYLWFYNYLMNNKEHIDYVQKENYIKLFDRKEKDMYIIPRYDLAEEIRSLYSNSSRRYHKIKVNSYFYEDPSSDDTLKLSEDDLNIWDHLIRYNARHITNKNKECILVEYLENNGIYIIDNPKIIKKTYEEQVQNILPSVEEFLKTRRNIKRITFPMFVDKKNKNNRFSKVLIR